jgi:hypothetical protein
MESLTVETKDALSGRVRSTEAARPENMAAFNAERDAGYIGENPVTGMGDGHANMQFHLSLVRYCSLCSTTTYSPLLTELTFRFPALRGRRARPFLLAQGKSCVSRSARPAPAVFPRLPGTPRVTLPAPATPWRDGSISPGSRIGSAGRELCLGFGMGGSGSRLTRVGRARLRTASSLMIA